MTNRRRITLRGAITMGLLASLLHLVACDQTRIEKLEEGIATEADVRAQFGQPENIWDGEGGVRIFEYNRQPAGSTNYMIGIGSDGKMVSLRQVLTPANFSKIQPGMMMEEVRMRLGKPAKVQRFALSRETFYDWNYVDPNLHSGKIFSAVFNDDMRVIRTQSVDNVYEQGK